MRQPSDAYQDDTHASLWYRIGPTSIYAYIAEHRIVLPDGSTEMGWRGGTEVITRLGTHQMYSTREEYTAPFEDRSRLAEGLAQNLLIGLSSVGDAIGEIPTRNASDIGFELGEVDHHGEMELRMALDEKRGSAWISKEMWERMGEVAGWNTTEGKP